MVAAIALVFAGEMLNTVVELTIDMITIEDHPLARRAKDVAAGAILVAAMAAAVMGAIIMGPRLWQKLAILWP
jgi:diacylglycerol kinase